MKPCRLLRPLLLSVTLLLPGCLDICDKLQKEIEGLSTSPGATAEQVAIAKAVRAVPSQEMQNQFSGRSAAAIAEAADDEATENVPCISIKAVKDTPASYLCFPNKSYGKFTAQVTVGFNSLVGLVDDKTCAFLEMRQPTLKPDALRLGVAAIYDEQTRGLRVVVLDPDGTELGAALPFANLNEVDLRVEQTATQLIFSARQTPPDPGADDWQQVHALDTPVNASYFRVYTGARNLKKTATVFIRNFAMDGDAIGGKVEYPIIAEVRASREAVRAAQEKIQLAPPELDGALADLVTAIARNDAALVKMDEVDFYEAQRLFHAKKAKAITQDLVESLAVARAALELKDPVKAKAQLKKLDTVANSQFQVMGKLLGWSVPKKLNSFDEIFSLRIP